MEPSCIRQSLIPGTTRLFHDYLYHFDRVNTFYRWHFADLDDFASAAMQIDFSEPRREKLISVLREQNGETRALAKLAERGTVAVVTGQQVGLFTGPAYTVFKALTAVRLAKHLSDHGIRAVPIFWLATEDHDLAEVDHAWVFDEQLNPMRLAVTSSDGNSTPVGKVHIETLPLDKLRRALDKLPFSHEVIAAIESAYYPGQTLGSAFASLLRQVLKDTDLLYIDPLAPAVREMAAGFLAQTVHRVPELIEELRKRNAELSAAGYHAQVHIEDDTSLLFLMSDHSRVPIRLKNNHFVAQERRFNADELQAEALLLSPNVLLRPVMQDYLLPTVSYVAGPSETAYIAQAEVLYRNLLGRMPVVFPRNSFTLLDTHAAKLLDRYQLNFSDLLDSRESVAARIAERLVPGNLRDEFQSARSSVNSVLANLESRLTAFDPTLAAAAKKSTAKMLYQMDKLSTKTARESMRRDERAKKDAEYLINLTYPHRYLQERFYSIIPFLAKHGLDLPQRLIADVPFACPDHMLRVI